MLGISKVFISGIATNFNFESRKFIKLIRGEPHCKAMFIK